MNNDEIEFKLKKDQYTSLIKLIHFADYCASNGLISEFKDSILRENLSSAVESIYKAAISVNNSSSISLNSLSTMVPFTEEESLIRQKRIEADLGQISNLILAAKFAKKDLNLPETDYLFEHEEGWDSKARLINEKKQPYLVEFKKNGISNLRFRLFYSLPEAEL